MIICCSLSDVGKYGKGEIYRISVGGGQGMSKYWPIQFLYPQYEEMVMAHKRKEISDQQYRHMYKELLGKRWSLVKWWLDSLSADKDITLLCFCKEGNFCHRRQIASMVKVYRPDLAELVIVH